MEQTPKERLEELRAALQAENISYGELAELHGLIPYIEPDDVELLEAAGVPENSAYLQGDFEQLAEKVLDSVHGIPEAGYNALYNFAEKFRLDFTPISRQTAAVDGWFYWSS